MSTHTDPATARRYCPACGRPDVTTDPGSVLIETRPEVRRHVCGIGGPGSTTADDHDPQARHADPAETPGHPS